MDELLTAILNGLKKCGYEPQSVIRSPKFISVYAEETGGITIAAPGITLPIANIMLRRREGQTAAFFSVADAADLESTVITRLGQNYRLFFLAGELARFDCVPETNLAR